MAFEITSIQDERTGEKTFKTKVISGKLEALGDKYKLKFERQEDDSWKILPDCDKSREMEKNGAMGKLIYPENFDVIYRGGDACVSVVGENASNRQSELADAKNARTIIETWVKPNEITNIKSILSFVSIANADIVNPAGVTIAKLTAKDCINHPYPDILVTDLRNGSNKVHHTHLDTMTADHPVVDLLADIEIPKYTSGKTGMEGYREKLAKDQIGYFVTRANELVAQR